ncbi:MAG TPA: hypothetical protein VFC02_00580 [Anaerolineales bacterium]|nr:hypothetical protein [Anaerolineales bacterium]
MKFSFSVKVPLLLLISIAVLVACTSGSPTINPTVTNTGPSTTTTPMPTRVMQTGIWDELLEATPYPHKFALPDPVESPLDGTYAKVDQSPPQYWTCYRCADYRPEGGPWRIQFDKGVMRIFYQLTNWKSIASFTVEDNRLKIFNDPFCPQEVGEYEWTAENGSISLKAISDGCAFDLRKENLVKQPWLACSASDPNQAGCSEFPDAPSGETPSDLPVTVNVLGGDSHYFDERPDVFAVANKENVPSPEGIHIQYHDASIPFGTHRVLWWNGDWIEATTDKPFTSIGVQFWGSAYLGWARVLFDGTEVWRGLTTSLGKKHAYFGGYIEITDFEPGTHTIRVENLGFDYHPVKVAAFGFSNHLVQPKSP